MEPLIEALSTREIEVLRQVAYGASNKEIGKHLHISEAIIPISRHLSG